MSNTHTKKRAFSMLELVFVIVIIGILVAVMMPRSESSTVPHAATQLVSKIRYAQHLALVDDKFGESASWYKNRWKITFGSNTYTISSLNPASSATLYAKDPYSAQDLKNIQLEGIESISLSGGCANTHTLYFDYVGRPLIGDLNSSATPYPSANILQSNCDITISNGSEQQTIRIEPESGYAYVR